MPATSTEQISLENVHQKRCIRPNYGARVTNQDGSKNGRYFYDVDAVAAPEADDAALSQHVREGVVHAQGLAPTVDLRIQSNAINAGFYLNRDHQATPRRPSVKLGGTCFYVFSKTAFVKLTSGVLKV